MSLGVAPTGIVIAQSGAGTLTNISLVAAQQLDQLCGHLDTQICRDLGKIRECVRGHGLRFFRSALELPHELNGTARASESIPIFTIEGHSVQYACGVSLSFHFRHLCDRLL